MRRQRALSSNTANPKLILSKLPKNHWSRGRSTRRCCLLASVAVGSLLLTRCSAFHALLPHAQRTRGEGGGGRGGRGQSYRYADPPCSRATRLPDQGSTPVTVVHTDDTGDTVAVLDDLAREDVGWEGHKHGFDWYLEQARRGLNGDTTGFSPLRMTFWRPQEVEVEELSSFDTMYIILRNLGQMVGLPSVDNAPVAEIEKYTGSWLTFLQKVTNGRLEDLAGGPLFLMLEKYFLANGERRGRR